MGNGYRENTDLDEAKEPDQVSLSSTVHWSPVREQGGPV